MFSGAGDQSSIQVQQRSSTAGQECDLAMGVRFCRNILLYLGNLCL
jgi:hypothetical protein